MTGAVPRLGADVPRWYGETIGFWDGDALITWTSNIQGWKVHSNLRVLEQAADDRDLHAEPRRRRQLLGLNHEAIFYDPEALVEPIRMVRNLDKPSGFDEGDPFISSSACRRSSRQRPSRRRSRPARDRVRGARHVRPAVGADLGEATRSRAWRSPKEDDIFSFE